MNIFSKKNKQFICVQLVIEQQDMIMDSDNTIRTTNMWQDITRVVEAETEEEAIGKFILQTKDINAFQKLDVNCYNLENLKRIK